MVQTSGLGDWAEVRVWVCVERGILRYEREKCSWLSYCNADEEGLKDG
jgi:hypothetical protein